MPGLDKKYAAVVGFHFQDDVFGWQQAIKLQKEGTINKFFQVQMCSEAKSLRPDSQTVLRHHMDDSIQNACLDAQDKKEAARSILRRFVDDTFLNHAHNIDAIEFTNETWGPDSNRRLKAEALDIAGLQVWNQEYRKKDSRLSHIRLVVSNAAVGNNNSLAVARVIQSEDGICGYHPYIPVLNGKTLPGEEASYSLRWMALDDLWRKSGVTVDWFFGEIGVVGYRANSQGALEVFEPGWGWQHPNVLDRNFEKFLNILDNWAARVMDWNVRNANRAFGGTIFSSGPGWQWFQLRQPQLNEAATYYRNFQPVQPLPVLPPPANEQPKGVDVSHWQGAID